MLARTAVIAFNTYREAVRARVLHGLFALALVTAFYSTVVSEFASRVAMRVVSDLGAASISVYGIAVAVVLAATSLYRELELKTIFPILARPISRTEYLVGKYLGTWLTIAVFCAANCAVLLLELAIMAGTSVLLVSGAVVGSVALAGFLAWRAPRWRTFVPLPWALVLLVVASGLASSAPDERRVVLGAAALTVIEVGIVTAIAMFFAAFSSPFLTAVFTLGVFVVGRSADTLARLPERVFGSAIHAIGELLSRVVPNLMLYVPPRTLLTGEAAHTSFAEYLPLAAAHGAP
jgi:ABC-type transport system involved in multi-copper enzyme maturation permease subunit